MILASNSKKPRKAPKVLHEQDLETEFETVVFEKIPQKKKIVDEDGKVKHDGTNKN